MEFPMEYKTVFVLEHTAIFSEQGGPLMDFDLFAKPRTPGLLPLAPVKKSLWTLTVEACVEYSRIVHDIFRNERMIAVVTCDSSVTQISSWDTPEQQRTHIMEEFAKLGPPDPDPELSSDNTSVLGGISEAIRLLAEATEDQLSSIQSHGHSRTGNRGRIICIMSSNSDKTIDMLEGSVADVLNQKNRKASSRSSLQVEECEIVLMNIHPVSVQNRVQSRPRTQLSPELSLETHSMSFGEEIFSKLGQLVQLHFKLASTTVTGIPMKEEQHANSSANYDVEILHKAEAHKDYLYLEGPPTAQNWCGMPTVMLKWLTPKTQSSEVINCSGVYRVSPTDVNSRHSACLTNFLLGGRSVTLELHRKSGLKIMSHMLAVHNGEIFIHSVVTYRSPLEELPSISEGLGGRVTDYRITDFGKLMQKSTLVRNFTHLSEEASHRVESARKHLGRVTRYWPLVISDTLLFNLPGVDTLPIIMVCRTLSDSQFTECKTILDTLLTLSHNENLTLPSVVPRPKGQKRDDQMRLVWCELELFLRQCAGITDRHDNVYKYLLKLKPGLAAVSVTTVADSNSPSGGRSGSGAVSSQGEGSDSNNSAYKHNRYGRASYSDDLSEGELRSPVKIMKLSAGNAQDSEPFRSGESLLSKWKTRLSNQHSKHHVEMAGRIDSTGNKAKLYKNLEQKDHSNTDNAKSTGGKNSSDTHHKNTAQDRRNT